MFIALVKKGKKEREEGSMHGGIEQGPEPGRG